MTKKIPGLVSYVALEGPHGLTMPHCPSFEEVLSLLASFAKDIKGSFDKDIKGSFDKKKVSD